jgi:hypothetical protein
MRTFVVLAVVLAAALATFLVRGRQAIALRDQAHADLLEREQQFDAELRRNGTPDVDGVRRAAGRARPAHVRRARPPRAARAGRGRRAAAAADGGAGRHARAGAAQRRRAARRAAGAGGPARGRLGAAHAPHAAGAGAGQHRHARSAATRARWTWPRSSSRARARPAAVPEVPQLQHVEAQLVLSGALPDVLHALESLAPDAQTGLPAVSVLDASLRRIEPARWGASLQHLATPPVRLTGLARCAARCSGGP